MRRLGLVGSITMILMLASLGRAQSVSPYFSYQGRAFDTNGTSPLLRTVDIKLQVRSSNGACLLYEELQSGVNLSTTNGYFNLNVGSTAGDSKRTGSDPGLTMARIFSNAGQVRASAGDCVGGYSPASGDKRRLRITIVDNGTPTTLSPDQDILSVPYATVAETLQGVSASGFVQVSGAVTQQNLSDLLAKKSELLNLASNEAALAGLAAGSSALYLKPSAGGASFIGAGNISLSSQKSLQLGAYTSAQQSTFVASLTAADKGKTWFNSDTNTVMYWDGSSAKAVGSATAITSLNGSTQISQSFGVGSTGTAPAWSSNVATGVHTLNLPLASTSGVTAGVLSYAEYSALAPKTYTDANLAGHAIPAPAVGDDGKSVRWNNTAGAWEYYSPSTGPSVTVGTASGTVAAGDDGRITGALQQTSFNSYVSGVSGAGACTSGQMMYWNSVSSAFACASIAIGASQISSGTIASSRLPAATGSADGIVTQVAQTFAGVKSFANNMIVNGSLQLGADAGTCDAAKAGAIRWNSTASAFEGCNGSTWLSLGGAAGTSPNSFTFTDLSGVAFNSSNCSAAITIAGLNVPTYASVPVGATGSPYVKVNGGGSSTYGTVQSGNTLQVCATSANTNLGNIAIPVTVGNYSTTWNLTSGNAQPNAFAFNNPSSPASVSMAVNACATANISGLTLSSPVTISTDKGTVSGININGGGYVAYTGSQTISNNQSLCVQLTTNNNPTDLHTVTVTIGSGVTGVTPQSTTFTVSNPTQDLTPNTYSFTDIFGQTLSTSVTSNTITISGVTGNVPVSVSGSGSPQVSINGGGWVTSGTIQNGQSLRVRLTTSGSTNTGYAATVQVGTGSTTWTATTFMNLTANYTTPGTYTFTVPAGVYAITEVHVVGAGAGGGNAYSNSTSGGGGGGGGYSYSNGYAVTPGQSITVVVGGGGAGNASGGSSSFNGVIVGGGGGAASSGNGGSGGIGSGGNIVNRTGGSGGSGYNSTQNKTGGGGGGAAGYSGNGGNGTNGVAFSGNSSSGGGGGGGYGARVADRSPGTPGSGGNAGDASSGGAGGAAGTGGGAGGSGGTGDANGSGGGSSAAGVGGGGGGARENCCGMSFAAGGGGGGSFGGGGGGGGTQYEHAAYGGSGGGGGVFLLY